MLLGGMLQPYSVSTMAMKLMTANESRALQVIQSLAALQRSRFKLEQIVYL